MNGRSGNLADGQPFVGELVAVVHETVPEAGAGVHDVLTTAVMRDPAAVDTVLADLFHATPD